MKSTLAVSSTPTERMRAAFAQLLDVVGTGKFRRQDLAARIYPLTNPRDRERANKVADSLIHGMAKTGALVRDGHLHWKKVAASRTLKSGRSAPEHDTLLKLELTTRVPTKWVSIDLETGETWLGTANGSWTRATSEALREARDVLKVAEPA